MDLEKPTLGRQAKGSALGFFVGTKGCCCRGGGRGRGRGGGGRGRG